jgi:hypothetical protein
MNSGHVQALFFYFMPISFRFPESRHVAGGIQNFISIFFKVVRENGCELVYQPQYNVATCEDKHSKLCNITENWITHDADVQYACENINSPFGFLAQSMQIVILSLWTCVVN